MNFDILSLNNQGNTVLNGVLVGVALQKYLGVQHAHIAGQVLVCSAKIINAFAVSIFRAFKENNLLEQVVKTPNTIEGKAAKNFLRDGIFTVSALGMVGLISVLNAKVNIPKIGAAAQELFAQFDKAHGWPKRIGNLGILFVIGGGAAWITRQSVLVSNLLAERNLQGKSKLTAPWISE